MRALLCSFFMILALASASTAETLDRLREISAGFVTKDYGQVQATAEALAATGDARVATALSALRGGDLRFRKSDKQVFRVEKVGRDYALFDPFTGEAMGQAGSRETSKIKVNNAIRNAIDGLLGGLTLRADDPAIRLDAAEALFKSRDPGALAALGSAIEAETDGSVRDAMREARASILLASAQNEPQALIEAVETIRARGGQDALGLLAQIGADYPEPVQEAAAQARRGIEQSLMLWGYGQSLWQGISLGSVLLLAAIGLAITFGVMGVINMAHGELVMLGAYTTFAVQEVIRTSAPHLFDVSLLIAAPLAFLVAGAVGVAIERGIVRYLYGRALETLLATWGVSLILQQAVRTIFGPNNREVGNPSWMSGAFELGEMTITYNRLWILVFALTVFVLLLLILKRTPLGLQMRAVTQNRAMAADMGVRTAWVDAMTFGLGAGIAGLAGVALSQIDNVSPNLGQSYIVDSFMVVVFGGAGNLFGALAGAFTLGIANKFLEPLAGAMLAKIAVLVFIILFIQKRPRGLFAIRGRAVEN
ncbi:MAG: urea ABC transporter permease subunit UrtB [Neomegalonema sp.]|nr:urea ABC transporter permease subunit UrtB [Neomegalonema sp.]